MRLAVALTLLAVPLAAQSVQSRLEGRIPSDAKDSGERRSLRMSWSIPGQPGT